MCSDTVQVFSRPQGDTRKKKSPCFSSDAIIVKNTAGVVFVILLLFFAGRVAAAEVNQEGWRTLETRHTVIRYRSFEDLKRFSQRINFSPGIRRVLFSFLHKKQDPAEEIKEKADAVFERVQEILDMRKRMKKIVINLYHDGSQLQRAYLSLYYRPCRIRAWYRYRSNTIYLNVKDLNEGMLAHEMAHAVIDHYMLVRPPRATAEILARYVDEHLRE